MSNDVYAMEAVSKIRIEILEIHLVEYLLDLSNSPPIPPTLFRAPTLHKSGRWYATRYSLCLYKMAALCPTKCIDGNWLLSLYWNTLNSFCSVPIGSIQRAIPPTLFRAPTLQESGWSCATPHSLCLRKMATRTCSTKWRPCLQARSLPRIPRGFQQRLMHVSVYRLKPLSGLIILKTSVNANYLLAWIISLYFLIENC